MHAINPLFVYLLLAIAFVVSGGGICLLAFVFCLRNVDLTPDEPQAFK